MKRPFLLPFVPLWALGAARKNRVFNRTPARVQRLQRPVLSVGSLSAGGAGKTPFVITLGQALRRSGVACDVLSRGYGRIIDRDQPRRVDRRGTADEFGDEPLLIARTLAAPVYIASQRIDAGRLAETDPANRATVHLLDDGFQHRQLARTVDIVLVTRQDLYDTLLPAGDLREPVSSLRRADILVLRAEEWEQVQPLLERAFRGRAMPPVWLMERALEFVEGEPAAHALAFCGIARPQSFRDALRSIEMPLAGFEAFRDHQHYNEYTLGRILRVAKRTRATSILTTAKDAVKLSPELRRLLADVGPLAVVDIRATLRDEAQCMRTLAAMLPSA